MSKSTDGKEVVKNLCASQVYHPQTHLATYTCNQKKHFGIKKLKEWLDSNEWNRHYPGWSLLTTTEQKEITNVMHESAAVPFLRNWNEVTILSTIFAKVPQALFVMSDQSLQDAINKKK